MKKEIFTLLGILFTFLLQSQVLYQETFSSYSDKDVIEKSDPFSNTTGYWTYSCKADEATGQSPLVYQDVLKYEGYALSGLGKVLYINQADQAVTGVEKPKRNTICRVVDEKISTKPEDGNVMYVAFMANFATANSTSGTDLFAFFRQGSTYPTPSTGSSSTMRGLIRYKIENDKISFNVRKGSTVSSSPEWTSEIDKDQTVLLVAKHICHSTSSSSDPDEYELYVNPDPSKSELENVNTKLVAYDNTTGGGADLRHICFRQMGSSNFKVGGINVAKSFQEAVFSETTALPNLMNKNVFVSVQDHDLIIQSQGTIIAQIFDIRGALVASYSFKDKLIEPLSLNNGFYLVQINNGLYQKTMKISIK